MRFSFRPRRSDQSTHRLYKARPFLKRYNIEIIIQKRQNKLLPNGEEGKVNSLNNCKRVFRGGQRLFEVYLRECNVFLYRRRRTVCYVNSLSTADGGISRSHNNRFSRVQVSQIQGSNSPLSHVVVSRLQRDNSQPA